MSTDERRPDERFELAPVRVRRRRADLVPLLVLVALTAFVGVAVVKPWDRGAAGHPASPGRSEPTVADGSPAPLPSVGSAQPSPPATPTGTPPPTRPFLPPSDAALAAVARAHPDWGIRAVVAPGVDGARQLLSAPAIVDHWQPIDAPPDGDGVQVGSFAVASSAGDEVLALGVTTPANTLALDLRFWRILPDATLRRVIPRPIRGPETGAMLWLPDPRASTAAGGWPGGRYRIDVLLATRIVRVAVDVPEADAAVVTQGPIPVPHDLLTRLARIEPGVFAFNRFEVLPTAAKPATLLDERGSWLVAGSSGVDDPSVGRILGDPIAGLGILLEPGVSFLDASIQQVAPVVTSPSFETEDLGIRMPDGQTALALVFRRPGGEPWAGSLALIVDSEDASGATVSQTWNLEISSTDPPPTPSRTLERLASWTTIATSGGALGGEPLTTDLDLGAPNGDGTCGGTARILSTDTLVGLVTPAGDRIERIRLIPELGGADISIATAIPKTVDDGTGAGGLSLIALPWAGLSSRPHTLLVDVTAPDGPARLVYTICVQ